MISLFYLYNNFDEMLMVLYEMLNMDFSLIRPQTVIIENEYGYKNKSINGKFKYIKHKIINHKLMILTEKNTRKNPEK